MRRDRVLIIDDSALMRKLLADVLASDPSLEVVGAATDAMIGWQRIQELNPDVVTLDVEMPKMDGLTFLDKLMRARPMPVVMISSLTERGAVTTLRALELGAVDFVAKPKIDLSTGTVKLAAEIIAKVKAAARARLRLRAKAPAPRLSVASAAVKAQRAASPVVSAVSTRRLIAIGASTGGTEALREVLSALPADAPGVVVVQHMPPGYTEPFAARLDQLCRIAVSEAKDGERILAGHAYIAPGNRHLQVVRAADGGYAAKVVDAERRNHHRPSVDVLFETVAKVAGRSAVGVILTGMGNDGAKGLLDMRVAGAPTIAQDEASCVVFGMPKEAIALGAAQSVLPLDDVAGAVMRAVR